MGRFSIRLFVRLSIHPFPSLGHPAWPEAQLASSLKLQASGMAGWAKGLAGWPRGGNGRTNGRTYGWKISPFYRTSSPIGAAALPPPMKTKEKEQGKGTADHLMPLGYLFKAGRGCRRSWKGLSTDPPLEAGVDKRDLAVDGIFWAQGLHLSPASLA